MFNNGVDLRLQIMERFGEMTAVARSENLRIPLAADDREICIHFLTEGDCIRSCTRSHAPTRGHNRKAILRYIRIGRNLMNPSRKRKFNDGGDQGSHRGH